MIKNLLSLSIISGICLGTAYSADLTPAQVEAQAMAKQYQALADKYQNMANEYRAKSIPIPTTLARDEDKKDESSEKAPSKPKDTQPANSAAVATVPTPPAYNPWAGTNASAGGTNNTGNSGGRNFNSGLFLSYSPTPTKEYGWLFTLNNTYQYSQTNENGSTANKFVLTQKTNYMFNEYNGVFANAIYTNDKFDTFKYQTQENIGYTRLLYKNDNDTMKLVLNAGPGFLQTRSAATNEFKNAPSWLTLFTYSWNITPDTTFTQTAQNTLSSTNTSSLLVSAITTTLYKQLALQTSFQWSYDSKVAADKYSVNTLTKLSLVYNF